MSLGKCIFPVILIKKKSGKQSWEMWLSFQTEHVMLISQLSVLKIISSGRAKIEIKQTKVRQ